MSDENREHDHPFGKLSEAEMERLHSLLPKIEDIVERQRRVDWAWASARTAALWVTAVIAGVTISWDALKRLFKAVAGVE